MKAFAAIALAHARNSYRSKPTVAVMLGLTLFLCSGFAFAVATLAIGPALRRGDVAETWRFIRFAAYCTAFLGMGMNLNVFTANAMVREKEQRIVESLLATPIGPRRMWLAKSLAIFLPGLAVGVVCSIGSLLAFQIAFLESFAKMDAPILSLASTFMLIPLLQVPLTGLVVLIGLDSNPVSGNVLAQTIFPAVLATVINVVARSPVDVGGASFAAVNLAVSAAICLLVAARLSRLSKERIVLSCKK